MIIIIMIYWLAVVFTLSFTTWVWMWVSLELLNWLFLPLMRSGFFSFMIWQSWATILALSSIGIFGSTLMLTISLFIKSALPPFTWWFLVNSSAWSLFSWVWFLSFAKILPLGLISQLITDLLFPSMVVGASIFFLLQNISWKYSILSSSISESGWMLSSGLLSASLLMYFMWMYSVLWVTWTWGSAQHSSTKMSSKLLMVLSLGLPPSIFFFLKISILAPMELMGGIFFCVAGWLMLIIYLSWMFSLSFNSPRSSLSYASWPYLSSLGLAHLGWAGLFF